MHYESRLALYLSQKLFLFLLVSIYNDQKNVSHEVCSSDIFDVAVSECVDTVML